MRKTFCDRCGKDCGQYVANLCGDVVHYTSRGEAVGSDDILPLQLCRHCMEIVSADLHIRLREGSRAIDDDCEMRRAEPVERYFPAVPSAPIRFTYMTSDAEEVPTDAVHEETGPAAPERTGAVPSGSRM